MNETELSELKNGLKSTLQEYSSIQMPDGTTKQQAAQVLFREVKMVSDEEKRAFDEKMQEDRFELEKDHKYFTENIEKEKLSLEKDSSEKRLVLEEKKFKEQSDIEKLRLSIEQSRFDLDKSIYEANQKNAEKERKFKYISLGLTILVPAIVTIAELVVYKKLAYSNLKLIYVDEGRPTVDFKDSVKSVKNLIK